MKLHILQEYIQTFPGRITSRDGALHQYKYAMLRTFAETWTFDTDDFAGMYDRALENAVTRRWWKRDTYRPKEVMLELIRNEEQYVREAFKELFNDNKLIENRVDRFVFYCDELLKMYKRAHQKSVVNNHYQDSMIISLYLAARAPELYTLYPGRETFNTALLRLGANGTGEQDDLFRFFKLSRTIYQYLLKDTSVSDVINRDLRPKEHLLLVHEFLFHVAGKWENAAP